jgi:integrase
LEGVRCCRRQDKVMLLAYLHLAARRAELFRLRWEDIDFGKDEIRLTTRKRSGGSLEEDWLPMLDELHVALLYHNQISKSAWVFHDQGIGGPYLCRQHWMKRLCTKDPSDPETQELQHDPALPASVGGVEDGPSSSVQKKKPSGGAVTLRQTAY